MEPSSLQVAMCHGPRDASGHRACPGAGWLREQGVPCPCSAVQSEQPLVTESQSMTAQCHRGASGRLMGSHGFRRPLRSWIQPCSAKALQGAGPHSGCHPLPPAGSPVPSCPQLPCGGLRGWPGASRLLPQWLCSIAGGWCCRPRRGMCPRCGFNGPDDFDYSAALPAHASSLLHQGHPV